MLKPLDELGYDSTKKQQSFNSLLKGLFIEKDLLLVLISGELKARYRRSFLGLLWTLINPIIYSLVLWIVFVSIFKSRLVNGTQFAPYLLAGVLTISFFNQGLLQSAESISNGAKLFLKIRVDPRIFCVSTVLSNSVNFFLGLIALAIVSVISGSSISKSIPLVFFVGLSLSFFTIGFGLIFSMLFVRFEDSKHILTIVLQLLTYLTPIFYPKEALSAHARILISVNPLSSYLDVFRYLFNGTEQASLFDWSYMFISAFSIFTLGIIVFRKFWTRTVVML